MPTATSKARWEGKIGDGVWTGSFNVPQRFEGAEGTNPEQLVGAAHAGCFSMQLSALLSRAGHAPAAIDTTADVTIEKGDDGWAITKIVLTTRAEVPGVSDDEFQEKAQEAKRTCPVSKALSGVANIELDASLEN